MKQSSNSSTDSKKLALRRQTLRRLDERELRAVRAGNDDSDNSNRTTETWTHI